MLNSKDTNRLLRALPFALNRHSTLNTMRTQMIMSLHTQQRTHYQTPPRHNQPQPQSQQQQENETILHQQSIQPKEENEMKKEVPLPQQPQPQKEEDEEKEQKEEKKEISKKERRKSNDPIDRLCKWCLLSEHEPSKCVWFKPNINGKQLKSNKD